MKWINWLCIACLSLVIMGCSTTRNYQAKKEETLNAFALDKNNLYIVGELYDYHIKVKDNEKSSGNNPKGFLEFLHSDVVKKVIGIEVSDIKHKVGSKRVNTRIKLNLNKEGLTEQQKAFLTNQYKLSEFDNITFNLFDVELVKLKNREQILQNGRLSRPAKAKFLGYSETSEIDGEGLKMGVAWGGMAILIAPIAVPIAILTYPFQ